jgi:hypothetical protein
MNNKELCFSHFKSYFIDILPTILHNFKILINNTYKKEDFVKRTGSTEYDVQLLDYYPLNYNKFIILLLLI